MNTPGDVTQALDSPPGPTCTVDAPAWGLIRKAVRVARQAHRFLQAPGAEREAARLFAFALAPASADTRHWGLVLLASRASKGDRIADGRDMERLWRDLRSLTRPTPAPRPLARASSRPPVEEARTVPLYRLLESLGFEIRQRGRELVMCCPFHDDHHPSLRVNVSRGLWYCDPCGVGGDGIAFIQRLRGVDVATAAREVVRC